MVTDRESQAEKDDPDGVRWLCDLVGELLKGWFPRGYDTEDEYTDSLFRYLDRKLPEALEEEDDADSDEGDDDEEDNEDDEDETIELTRRVYTVWHAGHTDRQSLGPGIEGESQQSGTGSASRTM